MLASFRKRTMLASCIVVALLAAAVAFAACGTVGPPPGHAAAPAPRSANKQTYAGWEALVLRNGAAEVTVVPAIGRIMQIALVGEGKARGPLWSHRALGRDLAPDENGWINFGGDKAWPAPQSGWEAIAGQGWPPPRTFDALAYEAVVDGPRLILTSAVDPAYGLRVRRTMELDRAAPVLTVETCYEKVSGPPIRVGVWTITQLISPDRLFLLLPARSAFAGGFAPRLPDPPKDLTVDGRLLSLARDPAAKTMIASDGETMLWVGDGPDLRIETVGPTGGGADTWPDGAHAQIYTSSDAAEPYVELELLSPLRQLGTGDRACLTVRYTLVPRVEADPTAEARRVLRP